MISPELFLILSALIALAVVIYGLSHGPRSIQNPSETPEEETRWKRFQFDAVSLYSGSRGKCIARELPEGLQLVLEKGRIDSLPIKLGSETKGGTMLQIDPAWLLFRPFQTLRLQGQPWLQLKPKSGRNFPELAQAKRSIRVPAPSLDRISLQGSLSRREYEIRAQGKLVASVTKKVKEDEEGGDGIYYVEIVKQVDPLPYLALVLALEFSAGRQGTPIQRVKP